MIHHRQAILQLLQEHQITFTSLQHEETRTSEESARVRGVDLSTGGKALLLKVRNGDDSSNVTHAFGLFILSAASQLDTKTIKREFQTKNVRFATAVELAALTDGLVPGSVPPFGRPILDLDLYVDTSITKNQQIAFNCGSLTDSIIMSVGDYLKIAAPTKIFLFSKQKYEKWRVGFVFVEYDPYNDLITGKPGSWRYLRFAVTK